MAVEAEGNPGPVAPCKCCRRQAPLFIVVDFNRSCADGTGMVLPPAGVAIPYHRCEHCGFLFTNAFDGFSPAHFATHIYNEQYALVDPDHAAARPRNMAAKFARMLAKNPGLRILDYGCGTGVMAEALREMGFSKVEKYDPMVAEHAARPAGLFDLVLSVEVMEHSTTPVETFRDAVGLLKQEGLLIFTTVLQPVELDARTWWYLAPRNGHVSLHTRRSLEFATAYAGCRFGTFGAAMHCAFKKMPGWWEDVTA